jgi:hypothetical protein
MREEFWDWPPTKKYHRRPRIERVEILPPRQPEQPTVRIDVRHHRSGILPQRLVIIAAFAILVLILVRSPGGADLVGGYYSGVVLARYRCRYCGVGDNLYSREAFWPSLLTLGRPTAQLASYKAFPRLWW